jgi:hypothetical protein
MTPTNKRIAARAHASRNSPLPYLTAANPYVDAKLSFVAGRITRMQAAAMVASDRQWIAECELRGHKPLEAARVVVDTQWTADLVEAIQRVKSGAAAS